MLNYVLVSYESLCFTVRLELRAEESSATMYGSVPGNTRRYCHVGFCILVHTEMFQMVAY